MKKVQNFLEENIMLRRDIADRLYSIVIQRIHKEQPKRKLTNDEMSSIWYGIYGKLDRGESETEVEEWCETVPLLPEKELHTSIRYGY